MKSPISYTTDIQLSNPLTLNHCGYEQCKPSHSFGPAVRPHFLIHYIFKGKGQYHVNGTTFHLGQGDGFLIMPGVTTLYCADKADPWEYCWIGFDGYNAPTILQNCGFTNKKLAFTDTSNGQLKENLISLIQSFTESKGNEYTILGQLYLCFSYMYTPTNNSKQLFYETNLEKALDYIHHNYTYDIKITDVAKYIGIDRTYLYKLFMTYRKISPQQYLINYRLNIAQNLLVESDLNVTEVAYSSGFKDAPAFYKHFNKRFHITPLQYRANREHYFK